MSNIITIFFALFGNCAMGLYRVPLYQIPLETTFESRSGSTPLLIDKLFSGNISIGTPPQQFYVLFDTGSTDIWVLSTRYTKETKYNYNKYDSSKSSTYKAIDTGFMVSYASGPVEGITSMDIISVGGAQVLTTFGEVTAMELPDHPFDGIFGLALRTNIPTVFDDLVDQNIFSPVFSFYIKSSGSSGQLILGGVDPTVYRGDLKYIPVNGDLWKFHVDGISSPGSYEDVALCVGGCNAISDTGTSVIVGPKADVEALYHKLDAKLFTKSFYTVDCSQVAQLQPIIFTIGGREFPLEPSDYIIQGTMLEREVCVVGFKIGKSWVLGMVFLRKYYSVYDVENRRVGFAEAI